MLSYRHSFHAGNFADVLKHIILVQILRHLTLKDKPLCVIDTHAGAGGYSLGTEQAQKTREFTTGIGKLWPRADLPETAAQYVNLVKAFNGSGELSAYPGSPWFAQRLLRQGDRLFLHELHGNEFALLKENFKQAKRTRIFNNNGFEACVAQMPPQERRGLVLMDPSYEIKHDYRQVAETLVQAHRRFETGVYAIWYPVVERYRIQTMENAVRASGIKKVTLFELGMRPDAAEGGMTGSGMLVVNPPWNLAVQMQSTLPYLASVLAEGNTGTYRIEALAGE